MRYTLLEAVQLIESALDSDEVNSYDDTVESLQVAYILRSVYYDMATELGLPEHETLFQLVASGDNAQPTLMTLPSNAVKLREMKYDNRKTGESYANYLPVQFVPFEEFIERQNGLRGDISDVGQMTYVVNGQSYRIMYRSNKMPDYWSTMDDGTLIFDSYDSTEDTTLQASKTMCLGPTYPTFTLANNHTPDLDPTQFSLWVNKAKIRAFKELKQQDNSEAVNEARKQKIVTQKRKRRVDTKPELQKITRFGRK